MSKESLLKNYQQYRLIIFPVFTAFASLLLIALVIFPQLSKLLSNNEAYDEILQKNSFLEVKAKELENVDQPDLKQKLDISLLALPAGRDLTDTMAILQSIISQSGFILDSLDFGAAFSSDGANGFTVKLEVTGAKDSLNTLLNNIENSYRPMKVNNVDALLSENNTQVTALITVNVFFAPVPKSVGSVEAPVAKLSTTEQELIDKLSQETALVSSSNFGSVAPVSATGKTDPFE